MPANVSAVEMKTKKSGTGLKKTSTELKKTSTGRVAWLSRLAWVRFAAMAAVLAVFLLVKLVHGQEAGLSFGPAPSQDNAPVQRMVRLTDVEGAVQVLGTDGSEFPQVVANMPLLEGMRVVTPTDARAEIEFEDGSVVRLAPSSAVALSHLGMDGKGYESEILISSGLVYLEVRAAAGYSYNVGYSDGSFTPVQNSTVRVNMDIQPAEVAVLAGSISVQRAGGERVQVMANESLKGDAQDPGRYFLTQTIAPDSWDQWNADRDDIDSQTAEQQTTARTEFAGDDGYGWSDLDAYGNWYDVPGAGLTWQPAGYDAGFDPYGAGYWMYYPGAGYVWVSGYQWGWLPYNCGSWRYLDQFGWGWQPVVGCQRYGLGWRGGGVNIAGGPSGYRFPVRPGPPRGPHPLREERVIAVGGGVMRNGGVGNSFRAGAAVGGQVHIADGQEHSHETVTAAAPADGLVNSHEMVYQGQTIKPLTPVTNDAVANGSGARAKDYPVNKETHAPVLGKVPPQNNPASQPGSNSRPGNTGGYSAPHYSPPPSRPSYSPPPAPRGATGGSRR
jgi:hypothetical protein